MGCGVLIHDQYILRVAPDLEWHAACLKCQECRQFLDENCTCFVRDGKTYCKQDYVRLFGTKCDKCGCSFSKSDFVMRAKTKIYHIECFRCSACSRQLIPGKTNKLLEMSKRKSNAFVFIKGDEFALREGGALYCKKDHDVLEETIQIDSNITEHNNNNALINNNNTIKSNSQTSTLSNNNLTSELGSISGKRKTQILPISNFPGR